MSLQVSFRESLAGTLFAFSSRVVSDSIEHAATTTLVTAPQDYSVI
jgi:hypothetical protein